LFHVAGRERLSRWQIGQLMAARLKNSPPMEAASLREYAGPRRAPDTSLNCAKAQAGLSFELPAFSAWLAEQPPEAF
jgi:dTDP-4-dehydrorhamnose reductase